MSDYRENFNEEGWKPENQEPVDPEQVSETRMDENPAGQTEETAEKSASSESEVQTREDGTYSYSQRKAMENPEEYRIPSYMRDEVGKTPRQEQKPFEYKLRADNPSDRQKTEENQSEGRYSYSSSEGQDSRNQEGRYSYSSSDDNNNRQSFGKKPKKSGKKSGFVVAGAVALALLVGAGCWGVSSLLTNKSAVSAVESDLGAISNLIEGQGNTTETAAAASDDSDKAAADQGSGEATISTAAAAEQGSSVVVTDVSDVVDLCMPSVVSITTKATYEYYSNYGFNPFFGYGYGSNGSSGSQTYEVEGAGSGIIIGDDGTELWIVTNNHVIEDSDEVNVSFIDESVVAAYVKGTDPSNDLAVVGVKLADMDESTKSAISAIRMGDSTSLRLGESVIAIGNALGIGQSVTTGVVSAVNREINTDENTTLTTIQTDAAINPGNSGGALLNSNGELIGINVAKSSESNTEGMGFAIPISIAKDIIEELTTMEPKVAVSEDQYPYLGVQLKDLDSTVASAYGIPSGILVYSIEDNSPVAQGGMLVQDIITKFNGVSVSTYSELVNELQYYAGGTEVTITVQRLENGSYVEKELTVKLGLKSDYVTEESSSESQAVPSQGTQGGGIEDYIPNNGR